MQVVLLFKQAVEVLAFLLGHEAKSHPVEKILAGIVDLHGPQHDQAGKKV